MEEMEYMDLVPDELQQDDFISDETPVEEIETDTDLSDEELAEPEELDTSEEGNEGEEVETEDAAEHNVIEVNGSVLVLPEEYEYIPQQSDPEDLEFLYQALESQTQAVAEQTELLQCGIICISLLLGMLIGVLLVHGFRLRRI